MSDTPRTDADCEAVKKLFKNATGVDVQVKAENELAAPKEVD